jgi:hypothetical protein
MIVLGSIRITACNSNVYKRYLTGELLPAL